MHAQRLYINIYTLHAKIPEDLKRRRNETILYPPKNTHIVCVRLVRGVLCVQFFFHLFFSFFLYSKHRAYFFSHNACYAMYLSLCASYPTLDQKCAAVRSSNSPIRARERERAQFILVACVVKVFVARVWVRLVVLRTTRIYSHYVMRAFPFVLPLQPLLPPPSACSQFVVRIRSCIARAYARVCFKTASKKYNMQT